MSTEINDLKKERDSLLIALKESNYCLVACLTGGEVSAKRAGKAIEAAAVAIERAQTREKAQ